MIQIENNNSNFKQVSTVENEFSFVFFEVL